MLRHSAAKVVGAFSFPFPLAFLDDGIFLAGATDLCAVAVSTVPNKEEPGAQGDQD